MLIDKFSFCTEVTVLYCYCANYLVNTFAMTFDIFYPKFNRMDLVQYLVCLILLVLILLKF